MVSANEDILRPLTDEELKKLLQLYGNTEGGMTHHYFSIYNQIKWNEKLKKISDRDNPKWNGLKRVFYTHQSGDLETNGTFVSIMEDLNISVTFHTLQPSLEELKECLDKTKRIDWEKGPLLEGVHSDYFTFIYNYLSKRGVTFEYIRPCICFVIENHAAKQLPSSSLKDGYRLLPLKEEHGDQIHAAWPHNNEGSPGFIKGMIVLNKCFRIINDGNGELVSWVIQNEFSGIGLLQTVQNEQGKGLGRCILIELIKEIAETEGIDVNAFTTCKNLRSQTLLKSVGFECKNYVTWIKCKGI